jgi:hypothetical protein
VRVVGPRSGQARPTRSIDGRGLRLQRRADELLCPCRRDGDRRAAKTRDRYQRFALAHQGSNGVLLRYAQFDYDVAAKTFKPADENSTPPQEHDAKCGFACHTIVADKDYVFIAYPKR